MLVARRANNGREHIFAALVHSSLKLVAELDILLLRPQLAGGVLCAGDLDNRLKTLLDSLSAPAHTDPVVTGEKVATAAEPLFTLLKDDRLVTRVNVDTDRLLGP